MTVVRTESSGPGDVPLNFSVRDDGIGMSANEIERVFDQFTQGDGSMTRRYGGTGLGLTISRRLIMLMGGELSVTSQTGQGSGQLHLTCDWSCLIRRQRASWVALGKISCLWRITEFCANQSRGY